MSDQAKWTGIYLLCCAVPLFFYFLAPLSPDIVSHPLVVGFLIFVPYVGLALVAVLGWQINQTRFFWASAFLIGTYHFLLHAERFLIADAARLRAFEILAVMLPLSFAVLFGIKESRLWSDLSLSRVLLAFFPLLVAVGLASWFPDIYTKLFFWTTPPLPGGVLIPNASWITALIFLWVAAASPDAKARSLMLALAVCLIPLFFTLQASLLNHQDATRVQAVFHNILAFCTITVILLHSVLHLYWKKVYVDPLTAVPNRQALDERLHTLAPPYSLAMVDIDHFKKFNDTYGHAEGDNVLRMVAAHLEEQLGTQVIYRYGGEEFCGVFEAKAAPEAEAEMERARATLEKRRFHLRQHGRRSSKGGESKGKEVQITVSIGVSETKKKEETVEDVLKRADNALYEAKEKGRNKVVVSL